MHLKGTSFKLYTCNAFTMVTSRSEKCLCFLRLVLSFFMHIYLVIIFLGIVEVSYLVYVNTVSFGFHSVHTLYMSVSVCWRISCSICNYLLIMNSLCVCSLLILVCTCVIHVG